MKRTENPGSVPNRQSFSFLHKEKTTHSQITNLFKKHFPFLPHLYNQIDVNLKGQGIAAPALGGGPPVLRRAHPRPPPKNKTEIKYWTPASNPWTAPKT